MATYSSLTTDQAEERVLADADDIVALIRDSGLTVLGDVLTLLLMMDIPTSHHDTYLLYD